MKKKKILISLIIIIVLIIALAIVTIIKIGGKTDKEENNNGEVITTCNEDYVESDKDTKDLGEFDWNNVRFSLNNNEYAFPLKVSDLLNRGFKASEGYQELLDSVIGTQECNADICLGDVVELTQDNIVVFVYFDDSQLGINVKDADVVVLDIRRDDDSKEASFSINGIKSGIELINSEVKRMLGIKNYDVLESEENYVYTYSHSFNDDDTMAIKFKTEICNNELVGITIIK